MTHIDRGHYARKHPSDREVDQKIATTPGTPAEGRAFRKLPEDLFEALRRADERHDGARPASSLGFAGELLSLA